MRLGIHIVSQLAFSVMLTTVVCLGSIVSPSMANATVYYVATTGSDANPGGQSQPFRTIKKSVSVLRPGDTLYIRGGTYAEPISSATMTIPSGTSWSNAITIAGYPGEIVTLTGGIAITDNANGSFISYLIFNNLIVTNPSGASFFVSGHASYIRLSNSEVTQARDMIVFIAHNTSYVEVVQCRVHGARVPADLIAAHTDQGAYGFYIFGRHMLIDGNSIYNNDGYGIHLFNSGDSGVSDNIIRNNIIYGNGFNDGTRGMQSLAGVIITSGNNNQFYNNIIYGNKNGVQIGKYSNNQAYNNTIYGNAGAGLYIASDAANAVIRNNIVFGNGGTDLYNDNPPGLVMSNNFTTDPQFVNASANDFSLRAGSPAIDAGVTVNVVTTDVKGVERPQGIAYDIGAYEYGKVSTPLPTPSNLRLITVSP